MLKEGELRKGRSGRKCSPPPRRLGLRHPTEKSLSPGLRHGQLAEEGKKRPKLAQPRRSEAGRAGQPGPDPHSHLAPPPRSAPTKQAGGGRDRQAGAGPAGGLCWGLRAGPEAGRTPTRSQESIVCPWHALASPTGPVRRGPGTLTSPGSLPDRAPCSCGKRKRNTPVGHSLL